MLTKYPFKKYSVQHIFALCHNGGCLFPEVLPISPNHHSLTHSPRYCLYFRRTAYCSEVLLIFQRCCLFSRIKDNLLVEGKHPGRTVIPLEPAASHLGRQQPDIYLCTVAMETLVPHSLELCHWCGQSDQAWYTGDLVAVATVNSWSFKVLQDNIIIINSSWNVSW